MSVVKHASLIWQFVRFCAGKLHERFSAYTFPVQNQTRKTCVALITHYLISLCVRTTPSWKLLMNNKFMTQTLVGKPTENLHCHVLAPRALNMSCSFDQSVRSIENWCVVNTWIGKNSEMLTCGNNPRELLNIETKQAIFYLMPTKVSSSDLLYPLN